MRKTVLHSALTFISEKPEDRDILFKGRTLVTFFYRIAMFTYCFTQVMHWLNMRPLKVIL
jgi:hypothetical protein